MSPPVAADDARAERIKALRRWRGLDAMTRLMQKAGDKPL
jgi:hypothetical protein